LTRLHRYIKLFLFSEPKRVPRAAVIPLHEAG
jgi:hypothetical protein